MKATECEDSLLLCRINVSFKIITNLSKTEIKSALYKMIQFAPRREHRMPPLETQTDYGSVAMILKLGCEVPFRGVRDMPNLP